MSGKPRVVRRSASKLADSEELPRAGDAAQDDEAEPGAPPEQVTVVQEIGEGGEGGQDSSIKKIAQAYAKIKARTVDLGAEEEDEPQQTHEHKLAPQGSQQQLRGRKAPTEEDDVVVVVDKSGAAGTRVAGGDEDEDEEDEEEEDDGLEDDGSEEAEENADAAAKDESADKAKPKKSSSGRELLGADASKAKEKKPMTNDIVVLSGPDGKERRRRARKAGGGKQKKKGEKNGSGASASKKLAPAISPQRKQSQAHDAPVAEPLVRKPTIVRRRVAAAAQQDANAETDPAEQATLVELQRLENAEATDGTVPALSPSAGAGAAGSSLAAQGSEQNLLEPGSSPAEPGAPAQPEAEGNSMCAEPTCDVQGGLTRCGWICLIGAWLAASLLALSLDVLSVYLQLEIFEGNLLYGLLANAGVVAVWWFSSHAVLCANPVQACRVGLMRRAWVLYFMSLGVLVGAVTGPLVGKFFFFDAEASLSSDRSSSKDSGWIVIIVSAAAWPFLALPFGAPRVRSACFFD